MSFEEQIAERLGELVSEQLESILARHNPEPDRILDVSEAAAELKTHRNTITSLAESGVFPGLRIGRGWRFSRNKLLEVVRGEHIPELRNRKKAS